MRTVTTASAAVAATLAPELLAKVNDAVAFLGWKGNQDMDVVETWTVERILDKFVDVGRWVERENEANRKKA